MSDFDDEVARLKKEREPNRKEAELNRTEQIKSREQNFEDHQKKLEEIHRELSSYLKDKDYAVRIQEGTKNGWKPNSYILITRKNKVRNQQSHPNSGFELKLVEDGSLRIYRMSRKVAESFGAPVTVIPGEHLDAYEVIISRDGLKGAIAGYHEEAEETYSRSEKELSSYIAAQKTNKKSPLSTFVIWSIFISALALVYNAVF